MDRNAENAEKTKNTKRYSVIKRTEGEKPGNIMAEKSFNSLEEAKGHAAKLNADENTDVNVVRNDDTNELV